MKKMFLGEGAFRPIEKDNFNQKRNSVSFSKKEADDS